MRRLLQSIIYNRKLYDRPQDEWTCGRAAECQACVLGPGAKGECRATGQCLPARKGDRWICTRPISLGAACEAGPLPDGSCGCPVPPCSPRRSLRAQRGRLSWQLAGLALGLMILALWGGARSQWSNPGPLTPAHAMSTQRCADCHLAAATPTLTAAAQTEWRRAHDELCLKCHDLGPESRSPHGLTGAELAALARGGKTEADTRPLILGVMHVLQPGGPKDLTCASCHLEHHGRDFDIKHLTDQQCQVCHQAQFTSLAQGHPEFSNYPYARRTRLRFDHLTHWQQYFPDARLAATPAPTSCANCHEPAPDGRLMLVRDFAQTCAACHGGQIAGDGRTGAKGLAFLRLPGVDRGALEAAGETIGEWPANSIGGLTPFMRRLLEADAPARAALHDLGSADLADLTRATPAQKVAAARLVWSVKDLMADLVTHGQPALLRRLGSAAPGPAAGRTGQFSADGLLAAQQAWLPHLLTEVAAYRRGEKPAGPDATATGSAAAPVAPTALEFDDAEVRVTEGGWYRRDQNYTLYYRPGGHADPFLTGWIDATANDTSPAAKAIFNQLAAESAPGVCMKCHTVDQVGGRQVVNWDTARPQPSVRPFTTFKHSAHFSLMGDQGCATCHQIDATADHARGYGLNHDPAVFQSNFVPMSKNTCVVCHQPTKAGDSCLQCHNYHTGDLKMLRLKMVTPPVPPRTTALTDGPAGARLFALVAKNDRP
jgi:hypothetical protein